MKITSLSEEYEPLYFVCLEDWSEEIKEAGDHKEKWYDVMKEKGLRVKLALDEKNNVGGMIQYIPIEYSFAEGKDLYFINCIWVHGYKEGRGNFQRKGMGRALLQAAEDETKSLGAKGIVAWGVSLLFWMKASWYKKMGYKKVDGQGIQKLLWKPFSKDAIPPRWIKQKKKPGKTPGKVTVTAFREGWCPAMNMVFERAKRASDELGEKVMFQDINIFNREIFEEWGITDGLFIDGKQMRTGPPPSYDKIKKSISKRVRKIKT